MKKLFFFVCFFSSFFFINNVKALSDYDLILDYDNNFFKNDILTSDRVDFIENYLIPTIDNSPNRTDFEYIILIDCWTTNTDNNNNPPRVNVYFYQPLDESYDDAIISNYVRDGYSSSIYFFRGRKLNSDTHLSNNSWDTPRYYYSFSEDEVSSRNVSGISTFLSSPTLSNTGANIGPGTTISGPNLSRVLSPSNSSDYTLYNHSQGANVNVIYYSSHKLMISYYSGVNSSYLPYIRNFVIKFDGQETEYSLGEEFPTYYDLKSSLVKPPVINNLGNNQYSVNSFNMKISNNNNYQLLCPNDREFQNGFCNVLVSDFNDFNDILNYQFSSYFNFGNKLYLNPDEYYIFTYRLNTGASLKPVKASFIVNGVSYDFSISSTNFYSNGLNKDIQIVLKTPNSISSQSVVSDIVLTFDNFSNYNYTYNDFRFGVFNVYKFSVFGSSAPTVADLSSDYSNNSLDGISNNSNYSYFSSFVNKYNNHGLSGVVLTPLNMIYRLKNTHPSHCTPLHIPKKIFRINNYEYIDIPCVQQSITSNLSAPFGSWDNILDFIQMFLTGIVCYNVARGYLNTIKSIQTPHNNEIEVVDL